MQARARISYLKASPRKMRQVADLIKGKPVEEALNILNFTPKATAHHLAKTVKAAAANAIAGVGTAKLKAENLAITRVIVDEAPTAKRVRFQSMGRVFRIRKRYCHLTVEVEGEPEPETGKGSLLRRKKSKTEKAVSEVKETEAKATEEEKKEAEEIEAEVSSADDSPAENDDSSSDNKSEKESRKRKK